MIMKLARRRTQLSQMVLSPKRDVVTLPITAPTANIRMTPYYRIHLPRHSLSFVWRNRYSCSVALRRFPMHMVDA